MDLGCAGDCGAPCACCPPHAIAVEVVRPEARTAHRRRCRHGRRSQAKAPPRQPNHGILLRANDR
eukprot:CAMPEP_0175701390 /NCGR_PEP_ID=MMETSP0097-20121207/35463_1 /TAXON_ID=311494 /ORGANISM="Alexandrium monilatum, Strain CCMP3105" /LENGTH=64 /DNA_ID=CAMNT_0017008619 /DNA_START=436 /DNA_END=626 /DNA_ORIENTATION=+